MTEVQIHTQERTLIYLFPPGMIVAWSAVLYASEALITKYYRSWMVRKGAMMAFQDAETAS